MNFKLMLIAIFLLLGACGKKGDSSTSGDEKALLFQEDLQAFKSRNYSAVQQQVAGGQRLFAKIFGGNTGLDVRRYVDERVKRAWSNDVVENFEIKDGNSFFKPKNNSESALSPEDKKKMVAFNVSPSFYRIGLILGAPLTVKISGEVMKIDDPHFGILGLGEQYARQQKSPHTGKMFDVPVEVRLETIVHESRHSDCTGGIKSSDLVLAQKTGDPMALDVRCGHIHSKCPAGHEYQGLYACDNHEWGAYGIGFVYLKSEILQMPEGRLKEALKGMLADFGTRINYDPFTLFMDGKNIGPDMSSSNQVF